MTDYHIFKLSNGIRIIHKEVSSNVGHVGVIVNAGTRDEDETNQGIAHFIEHMIFKGTKNRKAYHILSRLDDVGGDFNAYTSKEDIVIYASFLDQYYERTIELFSDILFNSTFPDKEIEKEKVVVLDEINSYKDTPSELIFDDFEELIFKNHPIGGNILGTKKSIKKINRNKLIEFIQSNFNTDNIVISSVGNISVKKLERLIKKHFEAIPENRRKHERKPVENYNPVNSSVKLKTYQTHCMLGNIGYNLHENKRNTFILINNILGGPAMNSRLNLGIREKHGYTYNIESNYTSFTDTGLWSIYFSADSDYYNKILDLIYKELSIFNSKELTSNQLKKAKQQFIGQVAVSLSSHRNEMLSMGKSLLVYDKVETFEEIVAKYNAITSMDILEVSKMIFDFDKFSRLTYLK